MILSAARFTSTGQPYYRIGIRADGFSGANALVAPDIWVPLGHAFANSVQLSAIRNDAMTC